MDAERERTERYKDVTREQLLHVLACLDALWRCQVEFDGMPGAEGVCSEYQDALDCALAQCPGTAAHELAKPLGEGEGLYTVQGETFVMRGEPKVATREQLLAVVAAADKRFEVLTQTHPSVLAEAAEQQEGLLIHALVACPGTYAQSIEVDEQQVEGNLYPADSEYKVEGQTFKLKGESKVEDERERRMSTPFMLATESPADMYPQQPQVQPSPIRAVAHSACAVCGAPATKAVQIVGKHKHSLRYLCTKCNLEERIAQGFTVPAGLVGEPSPANYANAYTKRPTIQVQFQGEIVPASQDKDLEELLVVNAVTQVLETTQAKKYQCPHCQCQAVAMLREDDAGDWFECCGCKHQWQSLI